MKSDELEYLVKESQKEENLVKVREYLSSRKLPMFSDVGYISAHVFSDGHTVSNSIILPVRSPVGGIQLAEARSLTGGYMKLNPSDFIGIPVYGLSTVSDWKLVTEGIFNTRCFDLVDTSFTSVATLRASFGPRVMHYLSASVTTGLLLAFDNDSAGIAATKRMLAFMTEYYPDLKVSLLDYPFNDLNDFLIRKGEEVFKTHMKRQIELGVI